MRYKNDRFRAPPSRKTSDREQFKKMFSAASEKLAKKIWMMAESKDHRLGIIPAQAQEIDDFSSLNRGWQ